SPEASYVRALALLEVGRPADALAALEGLEARLPELADRVRFLRGEALSGAGRPREALAAWASVPEGSLLAPEARLSRARASAALADPDAALGALGPLLAAGAPADLSRPDLAATALLLAGRLRAAGASPDLAGARRDLLACWTEHPLAPESSDCLAAAEALPAPQGGPPPPEVSLRRAEALLDVNRNQQALAVLEPLVPAIPAANDALACRARGALGRAYRKERSYSKAIETLRTVVAGCEDSDLRVRSLYLLAGAAAAAGERDEAVAAYRGLARDFPASSLADDALFFAADLLARDGRGDQAREALADLARDHADGDYRAEARFRLAWMARQAGRADEAASRLLAIEEDQDGRDGYEHARAAYWRARVLAARGEEGARAARGIWDALARRYPTDYYGLLARARLGEPAAAATVPSPERAAPFAYHPGPLAGDAHFRAGLRLLRMGLTRSAALELNAVRPGLAGESLEPVLLLADLLDRAGDHRAAHQLLRTRARAALRDPPSAENARAWRIAYPPAFRPDVQRWARPAGVPVELVQALMREESALDPRVVSPAGAVGLTQLMLPTAQSVARSLKLARPSRVDLMNASLNVRLGARYLGDLVRRFDGQVALALAAYNAGPGAVRRWLGARSGLDLDEFVEEIPIEETRGYVKRVLRSYAAYRLLYGSAGEAASPGLLHREGKS
ncbi:MAG TPA: transglycosylase SLT domain-containing protein, partial [Anaeromyxobacteraceae bacterium]|nr:transglycosylase SLT domain-containing protein [Anaeromyxobacteraceae bacterium]